ncbi:uncharacterized protein EV154DRAFT_483835 [Mucor mucedo]|uniref:uncharacterized protein n=1 Tax=Mucor mucedo TaxID=29922 RepID=UPI00221F0339|nr:uncharacterized protein EV154DRAFT_483835 [Mucor mucedo]KAI7888775.1 hypothetical protein EV154DRAFT_483835 [Mucor mucedo]
MSLKNGYKVIHFHRTFTVRRDRTGVNFNKRQNPPTGYLNGRQRQSTYVFREYYVCRRSGSKREHAGVVRGVTSVQVRGLQTRSKKIKCPAALKVVCLPGSSSMVTASS